MTYEYSIPLRFEEGCFSQDILPECPGEELRLSLGEGDVLTYTVPYHGNEVKLYQVDKQQLEENTKVTYDEDGVLLYVEITDGDEVRLIYIHLPDDDTARFEVRDFAEQSAKQISDELLKFRGKAARLFVEYYKSADSFDFAAKLCTHEDMQAVLDSLNERAIARGLDKTAVDGSGNYPQDKRIECDSYTLCVMLQCASDGVRGELLETVIRTMTEGIRERTADALDKTYDFKFIAAEYD